METDIFFQAPVIVPPELRLYYDDEGKVICYTCEKLEGNYLVIDSLTYAQARYDIRVIDGQLTSINPKAIISKLKPSTQGITCASEDISVIVDHTYEGDTVNWKLNVYELK